MAETNFVNVQIHVGKTTQNIQMEKGCLFQNKGGSYCVFDDGTLKFQKSGTDKWEDAGYINMTNYQWKAFQNVADNDGESTTFSKQDILKAQEKFKQGDLTADMSKDLPTGYKIEHPKMSTADKSVEVNVTNGTPVQSAKLKFQITEMRDIKEASTVNKENTELNSEHSVKPLIGADPELVKAYAKDFQKMSAKDIAFTLNKQILGASKKANTLAMFDAIPNDKLGAVVSNYNKIGHFDKKSYERWSGFYESYGPDPARDFISKDEPLLSALSDEWGIGYKELRPRIERMLTVIGEDKSTVDVNNIRAMLEVADKEKAFDENTIYQIEAGFAKLLNMHYPILSADPYGEMTVDRLK